MKKYQRTLYRASAVTFILWAVLQTTGCSDTAWISQAVSIINVLMPAISAILALVAALGGKVSTSVVSAISSWGSQLTSDLQNVVLPLLNSYNSATAEDKPGILNNLKDALAAAQSNLSGLLSSLHIEDAAVQAKVTALLGLVATMLSELINFIPVLQGTVSVFDAELPMSAKQLKKRFNAEMTRPERDPDLDAITSRFVLAS